MEENVVCEEECVMSHKVYMTEQRFLSLLRYGISPKHNDAASLSSLSDDDWRCFMQQAGQQSVLGLCLDALDRLKSNGAMPPRNVLMKWIGSVMTLEKEYERQNVFIKELASFFSKYGLKMVLMKGYGLSKLYPIPKHRGSGDLDVYFCGKGQYADELIKGKGIEVKQNEEKHSVYSINGIHVENHASMICEQEHLSLLKVEEFLKDDLDNNLLLDEETGCWLPSTMFNVVFLPLHFAGHFVYGGANLRQIVDYALVVKNANLNSDTNQIDWEKVKALAIEGGYFKFLCCLNGICIDYIGIPSDYFPDWPRYKDIEERILAEVLNPTFVDVHSLPSKIKRYFKNRWKYQLVYSKESHLMGFLLRIRSWVNWKWGKKSVWNRI